MRQVGSGAVPSEEASATFSAAVAGLRSCQDQVRQIRPELCFEEMPAPRTLAPFATAVGATVRVDGAEIATGRFVLLYDPAGQRGWAGPLRVIVYIRAELEPEIAEDPMVGEVAWSWLTEALDARTAGYAEPSGTVTRVVTEGFGAKQAEPRATGFELRASWSPLGTEAARATTGGRRGRRPGRAHGRVVRDDVRRGGAGAAGRGGQRAAPGQPAAEPMTDSTRARGGGGPGAAGGAKRPDGPPYPDDAQSPDGAAAEVPVPQTVGPLTSAAGQDPQASSAGPAGRRRGAAGRRPGPAARPARRAGDPGGLG